MKKLLLIIGLILCVILVALIGVLIYIAAYRNPADQKLENAGVVEKTAQIGEVNFNYAEGPDAGPPLVLLHAQLLDWYSYSKAIPELAEYFHVYAIDYPGHGKTTSPGDYVMSAENIGNSIADFISEVIGEPVYISGNSSGGLLTVWLAANRPELIKAMVLEDPPLFSAEYPAVKDTIAYKSFTTSQKAIEAGEKDDFLLYWVRSSTQFFKNYTGPGVQQIAELLCRYYRFMNPNKPLELAFLPATMQEMIRGLNEYDPRFGAAFYDGTWNENFDHAEALAKIECPALLLQADFSYLEDGTLNGAMSEEMAQAAVSLIPNCQFQPVKSGHVINLEIPNEFTPILEEFFLNQ